MTIDELKQKRDDEEKNLEVIKTAIDSGIWKKVHKGTYMPTIDGWEKLDGWGPPTLEGWQTVLKEQKKEVADLDAEIKRRENEA